MGMGSYLSLGATAPLCSRSSMSYGSDVHLMVVFPEHLASPLRQTQKSPHLTIFKHQLSATRRERCRELRSSPISQAETLKMVRFQLSLATIFSIEKNASGSGDSRVLCRARRWRCRMCRSLKLTRALKRASTATIQTKTAPFEVALANQLASSQRH